MPRIQPDREALEAAYQQLQDKSRSLDDMLKHPALKIILENIARREMQKCNWPDIKKLQANDHD